MVSIISLDKLTGSTIGYSPVAISVCCFGRSSTNISPDARDMDSILATFEHARSTILQTCVASGLQAEPFGLNHSMSLEPLVSDTYVGRFIVLLCVYLLGVIVYRSFTLFFGGIDPLQTHFDTHLLSPFVIRLWESTVSGRGISCSRWA